MRDVLYTADRVERKWGGHVARLENGKMDELINNVIPQEECGLDVHGLSSMVSWAAAKEKLSVSVAVPSAPVRVPSQRPLDPSVASVTSIANKGDNEMILRAVYGSPDICLTAEENRQWRSCCPWSHGLRPKKTFS